MLLHTDKDGYLRREVEEKAKWDVFEKRVEEENEALSKRFYKKFGANIEENNRMYNAKYSCKELYERMNYKIDVDTPFMISRTKLSEYSCNKSVYTYTLQKDRKAESANGTLE